MASNDHLPMWPLPQRICQPYGVGQFSYSNTDLGSVIVTLLCLTYSYCCQVRNCVNFIYSDFLWNPTKQSQHHNSSFEMCRPFHSVQDQLKVGWLRQLEHTPCCKLNPKFKWAPQKGINVLQIHVIAVDAHNDDPTTVLWYLSTTALLW